MIEHTQGYLDNITGLGREIDAYIEYQDLENLITVSSDNIYRLSFIFNTDLFKTIMTRVEIETDIELPMNVEMDFYFGVKVDDEYEYINKGTYKIVEKATYNADTRTYTVMAYDNMVDTMVEYSSPELEFPVTHKEFVEAVVGNLGFVFNDDEYPNYDTMIESDLYENIDYTYRDVLEDLVVATGGNFIVKDNELKLLYPKETQLVLNKEYLNEVNVEFGKHYGKVNSLVLSRVETDNIYKQDEQSIEDNGLTELKVSDNILLSTEYRNNFIEDLFDSINGLEYDIFDVKTVGIGIFEPLDIVTFNIEDMDYKVLITNNEFTVTQGLSETMYNEIPELTKTDYSVADTEDRAFRRAERLVDKVNLEIKDITQKVEGNEESLVEITQTTDDLQANFLNVTEDLVQRFGELNISFEEFLLNYGQRNGNNLIRNSAMKNGIEYWFKEGWLMFQESPRPPENPTIGTVTEYWYATEDFENYKRGTIYQWTGTEWIETDKQRSDFEDTFIQSFVAEENNESRSQTISNSIISVDSGSYGDKSHNFGMTEEIPLEENQEYLTLSLKLNNNINTGNIHFGLGFVPDLLRTQPEELIRNSLVQNIYEDWYCITPDEYRNMSEIKLKVKIPKLADVVSAEATDNPSDFDTETGYQFYLGEQTEMLDKYYYITYTTTTNDTPQYVELEKTSDGGTDKYGYDLRNWMNGKNIKTIKIDSTATLIGRAYSSTTYIFRYARDTVEKIDMSGFDMSNVTNIRYMFSNCSNLTELNISNWDTSSVTDMRFMFSNCSNLTELNISNWDTSSVTNMSYMFNNCSGNLYLGDFNISTPATTSIFASFTGTVYFSQPQSVVEQKHNYPWGLSAEKMVFNATMPETPYQQNHLYYRESTDDDWQDVSGLPTLANGTIWTWREFYNTYYQTTFTIDDFKANYTYFAIAHYPGFDITIGDELPETGRYCEYYALTDDPDPLKNMVYRSKWDGEFKEWINTGLPSSVIEDMRDDPDKSLPSPPFPKPYAMLISGSFQFADLKLEYGEEATLWTGHEDEIYGKNFKLDSTGFYIYSGENQMFIDEDEIIATYNEEVIFQITEDLTKLKYLITDTAVIAGLTIRPQTVSGRDLIIIY